MADKSFQVRVIFFLIEKRHQRPECRLHIADYPEVEPGAASEVLTAAIDLNDGCLFGIKLGVRKIRTEHQQRVGLHNRVVAGGKADQAGQSHIVGIVVLDVFPTA